MPLQHSYAPALCPEASLGSRAAELMLLSDPGSPLAQEMCWKKSLNARELRVLMRVGHRSPVVVETLAAGQFPDHNVTLVFVLCEILFGTFMLNSFVKTPDVT